jgi:hypothetical protein
MTDTISYTEFASALPDHGDVTVSAAMIKGLVADRDNLRNLVANQENAMSSMRESHEAMVRDQEELREALTQAGQLTETQAGIIERLTIERDWARMHLEDERKLIAQLEAQLADNPDDAQARRDQADIASMCRNGF